MLEWYRRLIALRRQIPELSDGRRDGVETSYDAAQGWLVMRRGPVSVAVNLGGEVVTLPAAGVLLAGSEPGVAVDNGRAVLPPDSVAILQSDRRGGDDVPEADGSLRESDGAVTEWGGFREWDAT
ncbi:MAG TPA: DUF3459 domain-containing protein [Acidimicrobiales bacterium]|nr:DUF3459 domain-containing protein [Acidimicrobiales bacterium]